MLFDNNWLQVFGISDCLVTMIFFSMKFKVEV